MLTTNSLKKISQLYFLMSVLTLLQLKLRSTVKQKSASQNMLADPISVRQKRKTWEKRSLRFLSASIKLKMPSRRNVLLTKSLKGNRELLIALTPNFEQKLNVGNRETRNVIWWTSRKTRKNFLNTWSMNSTVQFTEWDKKQLNATKATVTPTINQRNHCQREVMQVLLGNRTVLAAKRGVRVQKTILRMILKPKLLSRRT